VRRGGFMKQYLIILSLTFFAQISFAEFSLSAQADGAVVPKTLDEAIESCQLNNASVAESMGCIAAARDAFSQPADSKCLEVSNGTGGVGCMREPADSSFAGDVVGRKPVEKKKKGKKCEGVINGTGGTGCLSSDDSTNTDKPFGIPGVSQ
jgi:hypothetical protein